MSTTSSADSDEDNDDEHEKNVGSDDNPFLFQRYVVDVVVTGRAKSDVRPSTLRQRQK